jgi:carbamoyltransferase
MLVLGISGGIDLVHESKFVLDGTYLHDSAAVLVEDGQVVAGVEEERLNRIKHSNKGPLQGTRFCLESHGLRLSDLDAIAIYATEQFLNISLATLFLYRPEIGPPMDARRLYQRLFATEFGIDVDPAKFHFVQHHTAHAMGSYGLSGFDDCLILSADGAGEDVSTLAVSVRQNQWETLRRWGLPDSLGIFYLDAIRFLGYELFDEYKVMGLAPYGDPTAYRRHFDPLFELLPEGGYQLHRDQLLSFFHWFPPRRRGEPFTQAHMDYAATLQQVLEDIVFHVLRYYRQASGQQNLVLAGGVAQNSTLNGKILASGLFTDVYAGPSTADSGCALGAALQVSRDLQPDLPKARVRQAYWGPDPGDIEATLHAWHDWIDFRRMDNTAQETADLLASGSVIGWVQGGAEFGPRALGNRSILADPRPAANKELINSMIKKREGYRPFAPSILEERAADFFVLPDNHRDFPFMSFVMPVQPVWRNQLGAITHIDGTARLQTVSRATNPRFWDLIAAFAERTAIPILLNTSFNNNAEPIVNTTEEAIVCYLDSGLHHLVAGDFLIWRKPVNEDTWLRMAPTLPAEVRCAQESRAQPDGTRLTERYLLRNYDPRRKRAISAAAYRVLEAATGRCTLHCLLETQSLQAEATAVIAELKDLWSERYVRMTPTQQMLKEVR